MEVQCLKIPNRADPSFDSTHEQKRRRAFLPNLKDWVSCPKKEMSVLEFVFILFLVMVILILPRDGRPRWKS